MEKHISSIEIKGGTDRYYRAAAHCIKDGIPGKRRAALGDRSLCNMTCAREPDFSSSVLGELQIGTDLQ